MKVRVRRATLGRGAGRLSALLDLPTAPRGPGLVLTHGSTSDLASRGLAALAASVAGRGHLVARFNLPYREAGAKFPPRAEESLPAFAAAFDELRRRHGPRRAWAAGGRSYGGRVASLAAAAGLPAKALVFYSYPLHPPGKPDELRVAHWPAIRVPCLFLAGTEDPYCDLVLLRRHLPSLGAPATLHVVEGGDHALEVPARAAPGGRRLDEAASLAALGAVVSAFLRGL